MQERSARINNSLPPKLKGRMISLKLKLMLLLATLTILILIGEKWNSSLKIQNITIQGNNFVSKGQLLCQVQPDILNKTKGEIDLGLIRRKIKADPYVESVSLSYEKSGSLLISIREKAPFLGFVHENGEISYFDAAGSPLPYRAGTGVSQIPLLRCSAKDSLSRNEAISDALMIMQKMISNDYFQSGNYLSEIVFDGSSRSFILVKAAGQGRIYFGCALGIDDKIEKLSETEKMLGSSPSLGNVGIIDLRWKDRVIIS